MNYQRSSALFEAAQKVIPGGVNSPVRAFKAVGGTPIFVERAKGAYLYDVDGNRYVDFIASWGPLILGHAYEPVLKAVTEKAALGTSFGMPTAIETELASLAVSMVPGIDKIRFVNSGTEACMSAIRLARGFTKKDKIIKFKGCYHGHSDAFLIQAGSGAVTFGAPSSPGVTKGTAKDTLLADYNDLEGVQQLVQEHKNDIAAIIIEPVAGNMGCIPPEKGFLKGLRTLCSEYGAVLILDEVMTGFRLAPGGAAERLGIKPDMVTFGKVIGGGMPVGAFGGKAEIMNVLAPNGPVYQAGTLSGNPIATASGIATLTYLKNNPEVYSKIDATTTKIEALLKARFPEKEATINRLGSMISIHFGAARVANYTDATNAQNDRFNGLFHHLLKAGVYLPPSAFESWFISNAISEEDLLRLEVGLESFKD
jgi:glutamate-1-semialdehyde 2,1-aminomutase